MGRGRACGGVGVEVDRGVHQPRLRHAVSRSERTLQNRALQYLKHAHLQAAMEIHTVVLCIQQLIIISHIRQHNYELYILM